MNNNTETLELLFQPFYCDRESRFLWTVSKLLKSFNNISSSISTSNRPLLSLLLRLASPAFELWKENMAFGTLDLFWADWDRVTSNCQLTLSSWKGNRSSLFRHEVTKDWLTRKERTFQRLYWKFIESTTLANFSDLVDQFLIRINVTSTNKHMQNDLLQVK